MMAETIMNGGDHIKKENGEQPVAPPKKKTSFDPDLQQALFTDLLNKSIGVQEMWNFDDSTYDEESFFDNFNKLRNNVEPLDVQDVRQLEDLYLQTVLDFLVLYPQPDKFGFLTSFLSKLAETDAFEINLLVVGLITKASMEDENLWRFACKFVRKWMYKCSTVTHQEVFKKILGSIQSLPHEITKAQYKHANKGIKVLQSLLDSSNDYLPHYIGITELPEKPHWIMISFLQDLQIHKKNLAALLNISDAPEICKIVGPPAREDSAGKKGLDIKYCIIPEDPTPPPLGNPSLWNRHVNTLLFMLKEGVPIDIIRAQLVTAKDTQPQIHPSDLLLSACYQRTVQMVLSSQANRPESPDGAEQWWNEWQHFGEQFFSSVENGFIDFEKFVRSLHQAKNTKGEPLKDNAIIWLLLLCLPLEPIKRLFRDDISKKSGGIYLPMFISFYNKEQATDPALYHELRDTSPACFLFRISNTIAGKDSPPEVQKYLMGLMAKCNDSQVKRYRTWWSEVQGKTDTIDFGTIPGSWTEKALRVLSNFVSQPIATAMYDWLLAPEFDQSLCLLPGDLAFKGKIKPINFLFLWNISIRCRQRVLECIEGFLFGDQATPNEFKPPGLVETYSRLLLLSPAGRNKYKLQTCLINCQNVNNASHADTYKLQTLLEVINFRLVRFFNYQSSISDLLYVFSGTVPKIASHQLFTSLENVLIKASLNLKSLLKFAKQTEVINFGETLNRTIILCSAMALKVRGFNHFSQTRRDLPHLLKRLTALSPHIWSQNTMKYFHDDFKKFYSQMQVPGQVVTRNKVMQEFTENKNFWKVLDQASSLNSFTKHYAKNVEKRPLFLCVVYLVTLEHKRTEGLANAFRIMQTFSPQELTQFTYYFVDFLLDESSLHPQSWLSGVGRAQYKAEPVSLEKICEHGNLLSKFVWNYHLLTFETLILALADRDDDPNSSMFIDYLLLHSESQFAARVDFYCKLTANVKNTWTDETFFNTHKQFDKQHPDSLRLTGHQLPTYYSNICLRFLPILDLLFGRLMENEKVDLMERLIDKYAQLYKFHESPATFVHNFLIYYNESPVFQQRADFKFKLLKLLEFSTVSFSEMFTQFVSSRDLNLLNQNYLMHLVDRLALILTNGPSSPMHFAHQIGNEFPYVTSNVITATVIELLIVPLDPKIVATQLLGFVFDQVVPAVLTFQQLNAIAIIFASLPKVFYMVLYEKFLLVVGKDQLLRGSVLSRKSGLNAFSQYLFKECTTNVDLVMDNQPNKALILLQLFFHYSSIENLLIYPEILRSLKPLKSIEQLFLLVKLIAPFVHRLGGNSELLAQILSEIFKSLMELNPVIQGIYELEYSLHPLEKSNPIAYLETIVDFLYHCKFAFPSDEITQVFLQMASNSKLLCADLQAKLKNLAD